MDHTGLDAVIAGEAVDRGSQAHLGDTRRRIAHQHCDRVLVALVHQGVGHQFGDAGAAGDRLVLLARTVSDDFDQVRIGQCRRGGQDRQRYRLHVAGKPQRHIVGQIPGAAQAE